jgi:hypothetical protein
MNEEEKNATQTQSPMASSLRREVSNRSCPGNSLKIVQGGTGVEPEY